MLCAEQRLYSFSWKLLITVTANKPFTLPVVSTTGFAKAMPADPGYSLVYYEGGKLAVVSYKGITPNPKGDYDLTGCYA